MIKVLFTCKGCGIVDAPVFVRDRLGNEDICQYMEELREEVTLAHNLRSPSCDCRVCDLKIPLPSHGRIGDSRREL